MNPIIVVLASLRVNLQCRIGIKSLLIILNPKQNSSCMTCKGFSCMLHAWLLFFGPEVHDFITDNVKGRLSPFRQTSNIVKVVQIISQGRPVILSTPSCIVSKLLEIIVLSRCVFLKLHRREGTGPSTHHCVTPYTYSDKETHGNLPFN